MAFVGISDDKMKELRSKMFRMKVYEKDIKENFVRSSGSGGQNVNKVSSCVQLLHRPTGIIVKCQKERSQGVNRFQARCLLILKIKKQRLLEKRKVEYEIAKKRRINKKRSKKAKEIILADKHRISLKKADRRKIGSHNINKYL